MKRQRVPKRTYLQMGNGRLLATFDQAGEFNQIFFPHIDAFHSSLGLFRSSVAVPSDHGMRVVPIDRRNFEVELEMGAGLHVLKLSYRGRFYPISLKRQIYLHPLEPVFLDRWELAGEGMELRHESIPWMGGATFGHASFLHPSGLIHHRANQWLGVFLKTGDTAKRYVGCLNSDDCFRLWGRNRISTLKSKDFQSASFEAVQGAATRGAIQVRPKGSIAEFLIMCSESEEQLLKLGVARARDRTLEWEAMIQSWVGRRSSKPQRRLPGDTDQQTRLLWERSVDVLHSLQDLQSGALMASAEVDPQCVFSGGYGYCWPRDGAFMAMALDTAGFHERSRRFFEFLGSCQESDGRWHQRYLADGTAAPCWGLDRIQIDEPASVVVAAAFHYFRTRNRDWLEKYWEVIRRALAFLEGCFGPHQPCGVSSRDLWEERLGVHAYSLAAVSAAFKAGAYLARELEKPEERRHYCRLAKQIRELVIHRFIARPDAPVRSKDAGCEDSTADVSLAGLITPFRVIPRRSKTAKMIVNRIRERLVNRGAGGILRYEGDSYRGGNPWPVAALWLAWAEKMCGEHSGSETLLNWIKRESLPFGLLPEQVQKDRGGPAWVTPLGWSHAMFLLFIHAARTRSSP